VRWRELDDDLPFEADTLILFLKEFEEARIQGDEHLSGFAYHRGLCIRRQTVALNNSFLQ
jgi:hypothetical protein